MADKFDNYLMKIKLSSYINSRVVEMENDDGVMEKGLFIPLEINNLFLSTRNTVISWVFATEKQRQAIDGLSHYLKMKVDKAHLDKLKSLGYEPPYLGGMKRTYIATNYQRKKNQEKTKKVSIEYYE